MKLIKIKVVDKNRDTYLIVLFGKRYMYFFLQAFFSASAIAQFKSSKMQVTELP